MALNLVRNSRVFFTTNVNSTTGAVLASGFTTSNTYEIQVLDGFTFSQNTNQETVTLNEAGSAPVRGQRSFNTSLAPVDFSMSTYMRPRRGTTNVECEESVLWGALTSADGAGWTAGSSSSTASFANSNVHQLQKFGLIVILDNVTYIIDNCALTQATIDFGIDAIATVAWTGQATTLRQTTSITLSSAGGITVNGTAVTNLVSTENVFVGNVVQATGTDGATSITGYTTTVASVNGPTSLTLSATAGTGKLTNFKVFNYTATGTTIGTVSGSGPWTAQVTGLTSTQGISVGDAVTATGAAFGTPTTAVISAVNSATAVTVTWTGGGAPSAGSVTAFAVQIATLSSPTTTLAYTAKNTTAPYIANKLSTATVSAGGTSYQVALTGGSLTINNNITYLTPANLGVVNVPATYFTGTRSITGTLNAYLKTGASNDTGALLANMLADISNVNPKFDLQIAIGGSSNSVKVELAMPTTMLTIPTVDVQQVVSTAINFTAQGSTDGTATGTYDIANANELSVKYYAPA